MPDTKEDAMLLGQQLGTYGPSTYGNHWDTTLAAALACEEAGLDSVWLADHFMFPDRDQPAKEEPVFDCFVALAGIAARTSRIRIGELVVGVPCRTRNAEVRTRNGAPLPVGKPAQFRVPRSAFALCQAGRSPRCGSAWSGWKRPCRSSTACSLSAPVKRG